jgi:hypothetical protein
VQIAKEEYEPDLALLDRYQAFSAEVVRISLAGIGVAGFFLSQANGVRNRFSGWAVAVAALAFAVAAALALGHRYYSSDGIHFHLKSRRLPDATGRAGLEGTRNRQYRISGTLLGAASVAAAVGTLAGGAALVGVVVHLFP